ncbi:MAG: LapA family protein [Proteobacteria bacterium]|nr:LapA family protein [Pseudomonadota bacterium]
MRIFSYLILLLLLLIGVTFACLNATPVPIHYYLGDATLPLSLLLVLVLGIGIFLGLLAGFSMFLKQKKITKQLKNRIKIVEQEVENLRAIPLKDTH